MFRPLRALALVLAASLAFTGFSQSVQAALISTEQVARAASDAGEADRARLAAALERADVVAQLERLGVDPAQARERVAALGDADAAKLAQHLDSAPAGGIIGAILLVFFVLLLTDILGLTKVFPFTRSVR